MRMAPAPLLLLTLLTASPAMAQTITPEQIGQVFCIS